MHGGARCAAEPDGVVQIGEARCAEEPDGVIQIREARCTEEQRRLPHERGGAAPTAS
jgi:hypothetical protein